ncbi:MAG: putative methionine-R-sulfoxide reductase with GAF domain [Lysobacterales bacterium]|jgi:putative methionine-R-sulfoxide reductase with GAF domain
MVDFQEDSIAKQVITKDRWWDILSHMIDVLQMNLFVIDQWGKIILPPEESRCAGGLIADHLLGIDFLDSNVVVTKDFNKFGKYYQYQCNFDLNCFAIPILFKGNDVAYLIVGPVALNRRISLDKCETQAKKYGFDEVRVSGEVSVTRVVSNMMLNSILDMLYEIVRNTVALAQSEHVLEQDEQAHLLTHEQKKDAEEIYATVRFDEILATLLDVALKMTDTECGSIMVLDKVNNRLTVKATRGLNKNFVGDAHINIDQSIAGIAARENETFIINGLEENNNSITHLLKRGDIKKAVVMPLVVDNNVFGVLNLHTKRDTDRIEDNLDNLQYLSQLISATD